MRVYTKRQACEILRAQMLNERTSYIRHWQDIADFIKPTRGRFFISDNNKGDKRNKNIIDSTATMASRTLRSGMMAGVTSPARPWFKLGIADPKLSEVPAVKSWLSEVETVMRIYFSRSNLYKVLPVVYGDMGDYGTGCVYVQEDMDTVFRFMDQPVGSYCLAKDSKGRIRVFTREFQMTVRQIVEEFGTDPVTGELFWDNISLHVKSLWESKQFEAKINVCHMIKPNPDHNPKRLESKFKKFIEYYYEFGTQGSDQQLQGDIFLSEKGYDYFPVLAPRWEVTGEDVYANDCPGMTALGDVKQLQLGEKRSAQAVEKQLNPSLQGPASLKKKGASLLPGDITWVDDVDLQKGGLRPIHEVRFDIGQLEGKQDQVRERINKAYFVDLFLMLASSDRSQFTATEIVERKEEKLLAVGPVLEQIDQDLLDPLIDIAFMMLDRQGLIPEAPEEIQGAEIRVEYISIMAQAQKLAGIGTIERFLGFMGNIAAINPEALDLLDIDETVQSYADQSGAPLKLVRSKDKVQEIRNMRAQAAQHQAQLEQASATVQAAKTLSDTSMSKESALGQLIG
jgi:hypothetical protein